MIGDVAYRVGNWIDGESALDAVQRARDRFRPCTAWRATSWRPSSTPTAAASWSGGSSRPPCCSGRRGRGTVTDLRFCSYTLAGIPAGHVPTGLEFMAPEVRDGARGDPASDVYTAGAILYYAITGREPPMDPRKTERPSLLRPTCPKALDRILLRALREAPDDRYLTAGRDAGGLRLRRRHLREPGGVARRDRDCSQDTEHWEKRLRRALGDDYELLRGRSARGGFGRVYRVRDLHLEREVALKVLHPYLTARARPWWSDSGARRSSPRGSTTRTSWTSTTSRAARGCSGTRWNCVKGPEPGPAGGAGRPAAAGPRAPAAARGAARARPRPRRRAGPPRHQAGEPPARARRHASRSPTSAWRWRSAARDGSAAPPARAARRSSPARSSSSASGWTSAATSTAWPPWRTSSCSGETALPRRHAGADPRPADRRPVPGAARPAVRRAAGARERAAARAAQRGRGRATRPRPSSCRRSSAPLRTPEQRALERSGEWAARRGPLDTRP